MSLVEVMVSWGYPRELAEEMVAHDLRDKAWNLRVIEQDVVPAR